MELPRPHLGLVWGIPPGHSAVVLWRCGVITSEVSEGGILLGQHYLKGLPDTSAFYTPTCCQNSRSMEMNSLWMT